MTQTKQVITKRMAQKENVSITGTAGRIEKQKQWRLGGSRVGKSEANIGKPEDIPEVPKESRKRGKRK